MHKFGVLHDGRLPPAAGGQAVQPLFAVRAAGPTVLQGQQYGCRPEKPLSFLSGITQVD
jgi:hypothetical protein